MNLDLIFQVLIYCALFNLSRDFISLITFLLSTNSECENGCAENLGSNQANWRAEMKLVHTSIAVAALLAATSMPAMAGMGGGGGGGGGSYSGDTDILQVVHGIQEAINEIDFSGTGEGIVQEATNAANLIDYDGGSDIGSIVQDSSVDQLAKNTLDLGKGDLTSVGKIDNSQTATNLANIVSLDALDDSLFQASSGTQDAINLASYSSGPMMSFKHGGGGMPSSPDVSDFTQEAVNAANIATIDDLPEFEFGFEMVQFACADQFAFNSLSGVGDLSKITQTATNIANSIGSSSDE